MKTLARKHILRTNQSYYGLAHNPMFLDMGFENRDLSWIDMELLMTLP